MPVFLWKAKTRQGTVKKGEIEAANDEAVLSQLRAQMLQPMTVKKKPKDVAEIFPFLKPKISKIEMPSEIEFRDELPKTMIGKLSKKELRTEPSQARTS